MMQIGDKQVVFNAALIIPDKEVAKLSFKLDQWEVKIELQFHPENKNTENRISWTARPDGWIHIDFNGFSDGFGSAPKHALRLGETNTKTPIGFLFYHHRSGNMNRLDFHFLHGGTYVE